MRLFKRIRIQKNYVWILKELKKHIHDLIRNKNDTYISNKVRLYISTDYHLNSYVIPTKSEYEYWISKEIERLTNYLIKNIDYNYTTLTIEEFKSMVRKEMKRIKLDIMNKK